MAEQRKLRPVLDALGVNNFRQAVKLCTGLESKNPTWSSPKTLRAVGLLRLGRRDEAEALIATVRKQLSVSLSTRKSVSDSDEDALKHLHMFFRETGREAEAGKMYEEAWTAGRFLSELTGRRAYLAFLRAGDFAAAQRVATKLNRSFGKAAPQTARNGEPEAEYPLWAALAVYLGVKLSDNPAKDSRMMVLAQAMAKKSVISEKLHTSEAVRFLLRTISDEVSPAGEMELKELRSWITDGGPLTKEKSSPGFAMEIDRLEVIADVEVRLGEDERAADVFESLLTGMDGDNWKYWRGFLDVLFRPTGEKALCDVDPEVLRTRRVIERVHENFNVKGRKLRGPSLAEIELQLRLDATGWPAIRQLIIGYWRKFGGRAVCHKDLERYLRNCDVFSTENKEDLCQTLNDELEELLRAGKPAQHVQHVVSGLWILHSLRGVEGLKTWPTQRIMDVYFQTLQPELESTERQPGDDLILLSALQILGQRTNADDEAWSSRAPRIVQTLILLEIGMRHSPCNFSLVMMLIRLYNNIGAVVPAHLAFETLEVKHIQVSTLSHHAIEYLFNHGAWERLNYVLLDVKTLFNSWLREGPEGVENAINHGSFNAAAEFACFQRRLGRSWVFTLAKCIKLELAAQVNVPSHTDALTDNAAEQRNAEEWLPRSPETRHCSPLSNEDHDTLWFWNHHSTRHQGTDPVPNDLVLEIECRILVQQTLVAFIGVSVSDINLKMTELREAWARLQECDSQCRQHYRGRIGYMLMVFEYFELILQGKTDGSTVELGSDIRRYLRQEKEDLGRCHLVMLLENHVVSPDFLRGVTLFTFQTLNWTAMVLVAVGNYTVLEQRKLRRKASKGSGEMLDVDLNTLKSFHKMLIEIVGECAQLVDDEKSSSGFGAGAVPDACNLPFKLPENSDADSSSPLPRYIDAVAKSIGDSHHLTLTRSSAALTSLTKLLKTLRI